MTNPEVEMNTSVAFAVFASHGSVLIQLCRRLGRRVNQILDVFAGEFPPPAEERFVARLVPRDWKATAFYPKSDA